jgi:hypothetical protein
MMANDEIFTNVIDKEVGGFPFRQLPFGLTPVDAQTQESLRDGFVRMFAHPQAAQAHGVLFFWATAIPFIHQNGKQRPSTVSYIEITRGSLKGRWPPSHIERICKNSTGKVDALETSPLQSLADQDKNFWFYQRLVRDHGGLSIYYATLREINAAASQHGKQAKSSIREWENCLIRAYRHAHGVRPLKNRRC